jgi:hypothetical protein
LIFQAAIFVLATIFPAPFQQLTQIKRATAINTDMCFHPSLPPSVSVKPSSIRNPTLRRHDNKFFAKKKLEMIIRLRSMKVFLKSDHMTVSQAPRKRKEG